jgi:hypothetical protein
MEQTLNKISTEGHKIKKHLSSSYKPVRLIIEETSFIELVSEYENSDFIPSNIIDQLLVATMASREVVHKYSNEHLIVKITINDLLSAPITNWEYNRPPDMCRCKDIARYIYKSKSPLDTMIYASYNNKKKSFDIIDGIHRYTALKIIKDENNKQLDLISENEFGHNNNANWLYNSYILMNIRFNFTQGDIIELFQSLNKSAPIPDLYIRNVNEDKKRIIEQIVNYWQNKYPSHFSSNPRPNRPNINREQFINIIDKVYDNKRIQEHADGYRALLIILDNANETISTNIPRTKKLKPTDNIIKKCKETGCWLFLYPEDKLSDVI